MLQVQRGSPALRMLKQARDAAGHVDAGLFPHSGRLQDDVLPGMALLKKSALTQVSVPVNSDPNMCEKRTMRSHRLYVLITRGVQAAPLPLFKLGNADLIGTRSFGEFIPFDDIVSRAQLSLEPLIGARASITISFQSGALLSDEQ